MRIGLIGGFTQQVTDGFIDEFRNKQKVKAELVFSNLDDICTDCLESLVEDNNLSLLFIDANVTINNGCLCQSNKELSQISKKHGCTIYFVSEDPEKWMV